MKSTFELIQSLRTSADTRIVLLVIDGLGGLPKDDGGPTELEAARTPNLDRLAAAGICGLHVPAGTGITPGSGPGHLALFGYDPRQYQVGRGVLSALGSGFELTHDDVAARGNFCTVDAEGRVTDRRAGRIETERNRALCERLKKIALPGVEVHVETVKEHRFLFVLRGKGLSAEVADTDPQKTGVEPLAPQPTTEAGRKTAELIAKFVEQARTVLGDQEPANMILLRGFAKLPDWPSLPDVFGLRAAALADYPMYRGVARLVGMMTIEVGPALEDKIEHARQRWSDFDFFFIHHKKTDSAGEDGAFDRKVEEIEKIDTALPGLLALEPDVVIVTGDHSTPAALRQHSWHPVPVLLWSRYCRPDGVREFGERACVTGALGPRFRASELLPLALANALRLEKFGA
jgi:2,3-bisphosphoglycerate-independent phosphoglycerate mutase